MARRVLLPLALALLVGFLAVWEEGDDPALAPDGTAAPAAPGPGPRSGSDPASGGADVAAATPPADPFSVIADVAVHLNDGSPIGEPATGPVAAGSLVDLVAVVRANATGVRRTEIWSFSADGGNSWQEISRTVVVSGMARESYRVRTWTAPAAPGEYRLRYRIEEQVGERTHADQKETTFRCR